MKASPYASRKNGLSKKPFLWYAFSEYLALDLPQT